MTFERFSANTPPLAWDEPGTPPTGPLDGPRAQVAEVHGHLEWLERQPRPPCLSEARWFALLKDARAFTGKWLEIALSHGWPLLDLYGTAPLVERRRSREGVVMLLGGRTIDKIDSGQIVIANRIGPPNVWRLGQNGTRAPHQMHGAVLLWEALP